MSETTDTLVMEIQDEIDRFMIEVHRISKNDDYISKAALRLIRDQINHLTFSELQNL
jgi:hypothetical protein